MTIVRRGSRDNVERHYLHLSRREVGLEKTELPKNWTCISEKDKKTYFVRLENFLLNKQRAATEVIGVSFYIKKLWCCVGGKYNKIIWFYQLG